MVRVPATRRATQRPAPKQRPTSAAAAARRGPVLTPGTPPQPQRTTSSAAGLVRVLTFLVLGLCISAPEELMYTHVNGDLNPYTGAMKLILLAMASLLLMLCRPRMRHWAIARPFAVYIGWAVICWAVAGAELLPARNLVSSFGGILVLAALCAAAEYLGGVYALVRILVVVVIVGTVCSVLLGIAGLQPMPLQLKVATQLEWFHGIGVASYMIAPCAALIAWVLARHFARPSSWTELEIVLLFIIPALAFYRTFLIGIAASIGAAALAGLLQIRYRKQLRFRPFDRGYKRLAWLIVVVTIVGAAAYFMKSSTRPEGETLSGREIIWPIEIASTFQHPVFGLGPFGDIELLRFAEDLPQVGAAHSEYLGAAVCYGIPGLILFCVSLFGIWNRIRKFVPASLAEYSCRYASLFVLLGLFITSIAENVIRDPRLFAIYLLFPALTLCAEKRRLERRPQ